MKLENRCNFYIYNKNNKKHYRCKNCYYKSIKYFDIKNTKLCWNHYNKYCKSYIINIQKIYRGYKCRKYINNIYKNLPCDIQNKIKFYINVDYKYNRYCKTIYKLLLKRFKLYYTLYNKYNILSYIDNDYYLDFMNDNFDSIDNVYYLYNKYFDLIKYLDYDLIKHEYISLIIDSNYILEIINLVSRYVFYNIEDYTIYDLINGDISQEVYDENNNNIIMYYRLNKCKHNINDFYNKSVNCNMLSTS